MGESDCHNEQTPLAVPSTLTPPPTDPIEHQPRLRPRLSGPHKLRPQLRQLLRLPTARLLERGRLHHHLSNRVSQTMVRPDKRPEAE